MSWKDLNWTHYTLISLVIVFLIILPLSKRWALTFARTSVLAIVGTLMMVPFVWLFCSAFKDKDVINNYTFLPPPQHWFAKIGSENGAKPAENARTNLNLENFNTLFGQTETIQGPVTFWRYLGNSMFLASASTIITLFFSSLGGYALAKYKFRGSNLILGLMLGSMMIPGFLLLAPVFSLIFKLGWMDTYYSMLIPGACSVFWMILFRQAVVAVPTDIIEAGRIDGCSEFKIYLMLVMPLIRPMIGAFCLVSFLGSWNNFIGPNIFLQSQSKVTLPVVLNQYIATYNQQYGVFLAGTLLAILPPAILFFALQREFVSGLSAGAVKQ